MRLSEASEAFLAVRRQEGFSSHTIEAYRLQLPAGVRWNTRWSNFHSRLVAEWRKFSGSTGTTLTGNVEPSQFSERGQRRRGLFWDKVPDMDATLLERKNR